MPTVSDVEQIIEYVDDAKRAAAGERVSGEPLAEFIARVLVELRAARARLARIEPVYALARRWCNRPASVIAEGRDVLRNDAELWLELRRRVEAVTLDPGEER
jgi:hypothetical protein